jgi:hypothetical protein
MATSIFLVVHHWSHDYIHPQTQNKGNGSLMVIQLHPFKHIAWFTNITWLHPFAWWFITGLKITSTHNTKRKGNGSLMVIQLHPPHKCLKQVLGTDQPQVQWLAHAHPLQSTQSDHSSYK